MNPPINLVLGPRPDEPGPPPSADRPPTLPRSCNASAAMRRRSSPAIRRPVRPCCRCCTWCKPKTDTSRLPESPSVPSSSTSPRPRWRRSPRFYSMYRRTPHRRVSGRGGLHQHPVRHHGRRRHPRNAATRTRHPRGRHHQRRPHHPRAHRMQRRLRLRTRRHGQLGILRQPNPPTTARQLIADIRAGKPPPHPPTRGRTAVPPLPQHRTNIGRARSHRPGRGLRWC